MYNTEIEWPDPRVVFAETVPPGCRWLWPTSHDVARLIELAASYPAIAVGLESCHLAEEFYRNEVALRDAADAAARRVYLVALERDDRLVAFASVEYVPAQRLLAGRLAVVASSERNAGLGRILGAEFPERVGRAIGAEILMHYVTLSHIVSQRVLIDAGYHVVGVVPGHDRDLVSRGEVKRVWEACLVKLLVPPDAVERPRPENLHPETAHLIEALGL